MLVSWLGFVGWFFYCWSVGCMFFYGWSFGCFVGIFWLIDGCFSWLCFGSLTCRLVGRLAGWLAGWSVG